MIGLSLAVSGCASSTPFASAQTNLADVPAYVRNNVKLTPVPKGPLNESGTKKFIVALRRSEVNKARALRISIANHNYNRTLYAQQPRQGILTWPGDKPDYHPINPRSSQYRGLLGGLQ